MRQLKEAGVEAVAVCFLFSFLNPEHEARVAEIVREEFPEAFLSVSSEVLPQYREYERFSTVCLNAYIGPKVASYVRRLEEELRTLDVRTDVHLMTSASGVVDDRGGGRAAGEPPHVGAGRRRRRRHLGRDSRPATRTSSRSTSAARRPTSGSPRAESSA